jgi:hypothetical protein
MGAYGSDHHYDFVLDRLLAGLRATSDDGTSTEREREKPDNRRPR